MYVTKAEWQQRLLVPRCESQPRDRPGAQMAPGKRLRAEYMLSLDRGRKQFRKLPR